MTTPRTPRPARAARPARLLAAALVTGALCATAACTGGDTGSPSASRGGVGPGRQAAAAPTTSPASPSASPGLTAAGARLALITEADIEDAWNQVSQRTARSWRDRLLVGKVDMAQFLTGRADAADCRRLADSLFDETLLGRPSGASALTGFQEGDSRLLYQVAAYDRAALDRSMRRLRSLPQTCDRFTLTGEDGAERTVEVVETSLPRVGDARQGLTVTVRGSADGDPVTLTLSVAVVRVGTDAITVTQGGLDGAGASTTEAAVRQGTQRLETVLAGRTPTPTPPVLD
ncbi:hypothetical protein AB0E75_05985 [Streptomyces griseoviridis]|uniref:Lipoprotein n=3 Tax=Streptomyces TaxID=1883 RepID=A0A918GL09_STRGD|nr:MULTISPECIES: hypothetical protein [Streptomyces]MDP9685796.1 hypothetical protein [Streptomyces griseoviridis]GGS43598.1 lipoprotein [Streptomyces niveoruber]GGS77253.1 lipoprotein [Streptomyces griseoviridis]GGU14663.1 lipoprotein [Streptomyces daghestanicus]GHI35085.1 lipoprotein [Streptomyces daghestanicus]